MRNYLIINISILLLFLVSFTSCDNKNKPEEGVYYTCSMHPEIKENKPGQCPICHMDLTKTEEKK